MPGVLQFMGSQRVRHDSATELNSFQRDFILFILTDKSFHVLGPAFISLVPSPINLPTHHTPFTVAEWNHGKDPNAEKDCRHEEKGTTEDEMIG